MNNKKFNLKSMLVGVIVGAGLFGGVVGASTLVSGDVYLSPFPIMANGKSYTATLPILNYNGSTYVPLKELATLTNTDVSFSNSTIYIKNKAQATTKPTVVAPTYTTSSLEIDEGDKTTVPVNLEKYGATTATATVSDNCIKLSQSYFSKSGNLTVTGNVAGNATLTIKYDTGNIEYISVSVEEEIDEEDIEVEVGKYENVYIDLDDYDADEATISITSGKAYISLNKTSITSSGNLRIKGVKEGEAIVRVKYDTGDYSYINVEVIDDDDDDDDDDDGDSESDLEIEAGKYEYVYIDLDDYDADEVEISVSSGKSYVSVNKTELTSSGNIKITGVKEGESTIKFKFDSGDTAYLYVEVIDDDDDADYDDYEYEAEFEIEDGKYDYIYVDLDFYDADEATLSIIAGKSHITLGKTSVDYSRNVKVTGKSEGEAIVLVEYDTGDEEYFWIEVTE